MPKKIMNKIKFSHNYPKLWSQTSGRLLAVEVLDAKDVQANKDLIEYDTKYVKNVNVCYDETNFDYDYYPLPRSGNLIQLVFIGNKGIPFCTIRPAFGRLLYLGKPKIEYYRDKIGQEFEIAIQEVRDDK